MNSPSACVTSFDGDYGRLNGLTLLAGFKYIGPSKTSVAFPFGEPAE